MFYFGKKVLSRQIGPFISECLMLGVLGINGGVALAVPDKPVENGSKLH